MTTVHYRPRPDCRLEERRAIHCEEGSWYALTRCLVERCASDLLDTLDTIMGLDTPPGSLVAIQRWMRDWMDANEVIEFLSESDDDRLMRVQRRARDVPKYDRTTHGEICWVYICEGGPSYGVLVPHRLADRPATLRSAS